jgi:hypothetical protein
MDDPNPTRARRARESRDRLISVLELSLQLFMWTGVLASAAALALGI